MPKRPCNPCDTRGYIIIDDIIKCPYCNATGLKWGKTCEGCNGNKFKIVKKVIDCTFCDGKGHIEY